MIEIYPENQTDFSRHGVTLHPTSCLVTYQAGARYDIDVVFPLLDGGQMALEAQLLRYGRILYASVPPQHIPAIQMGIISYWQIPSSASASVPLYKTLGYSTRITYSEWVPMQHYMAGNRVTSSNQNYQCLAEHDRVGTPPAANPGLWKTIPNYEQVPGRVIASLEPGSSLIKLADYNDSYMRASTTGGLQGFVEISKCQRVGSDEPYILPARDILRQPFIITEIQKNSQQKTITVHGMHDTYRLNGMLLGECSLTGATPQTALALINGAMMDVWSGLLATNISTETVSKDYSWKMAGDVLLNPSSGFVASLNARLIRDKRDLIIIANGQTDPVYRVAYGVNLRGVVWKGNIDKLKTRIYPKAKAADDTLLMLPEEYIETTREVPYTVMEMLDTGLKVGAKEDQTDGTTITLTEEIVLQRMRDMAEARFEVDHCDQPDVSLDLDFLRMGDTEEFRQYRGLEQVNPYDWITVAHGPMDISAVIQMIGYVWDSILERYQKASFGDARNYVGRDVTDWDLRSGSVTARALDEALKKQLGV